MHNLNIVNNFIDICKLGPHQDLNKIKAFSRDLADTLKYLTGNNFLKEVKQIAQARFKIPENEMGHVSEYVSNIYKELKDNEQEKQRYLALFNQLYFFTPQTDQSLYQEVETFLNNSLVQVETKCDDIEIEKLEKPLDEEYPKITVGFAINYHLNQARLILFYYDLSKLEKIISCLYEPGLNKDNFQQILDLEFSELKEVDNETYEDLQAAFMGLFFQLNYFQENPYIKEMFISRLKERVQTILEHPEKDLLNGLDSNNSHLLDQYVISFEIDESDYLDGEEVQNLDEQSEEVIKASKRQHDLVEIELLPPKKKTKREPFQAQVLDILVLKDNSVELDQLLKTKIEQIVLELNEIRDSKKPDISIEDHHYNEENRNNIVKERQDAIMNGYDEAGYTFIHYVIERGCPWAIPILVKYGADVNQPIRETNIYPLTIAINKSLDIYDKNKEQALTIKHQLIIQLLKNGCFPLLASDIHSIFYKDFNCQNLSLLEALIEAGGLIGTSLKFNETQDVNVLNLIEVVQNMRTKGQHILAFGFNMLINKTVQAELMPAGMITDSKNLIEIIKAIKANHPLWKPFVKQVVYQIGGAVTRLFKQEKTRILILEELHDTSQKFKTFLEILGQVNKIVEENVSFFEIKRNIEDYLVDVQKILSTKNLQEESEFFLTLLAQRLEEIVKGFNQEDFSINISESQKGIKLTEIFAADLQAKIAGLEKEKALSNKLLNSLPILLREINQYLNDSFNEPISLRDLCLLELARSGNKGNQLIRNNIAQKNVINPTNTIHYLVGKIPRLLNYK
jgi:hypothetical protein